MKAIFRHVDLHCPECGSLLRAWSPVPLDEGYDPLSFVLVHPSGDCSQAEKKFALPTVELQEIP